MTTVQHKFRTKYLQGTHSAKAVYGIILITAALITFQLHEEKASTMAFKIFLAGLVIVLAEVYSEILGDQIRRKTSLTSADRREILEDSMIISSVSLYPTGVFLLSAAGLYSADLALDICYTLSIAGLGLFGYIAARASGNTKLSSYIKALLAAAIGTSVILIKFHFSH